MGIKALLSLVQFQPIWSPSNCDARLPLTAIRGGHLFTPTYVGRVEHEGLILAAAITAARKAYVAWNGEVHKKDHYEILTGDGYEWRRVMDHQIPENAVGCSKTESGTSSLYIGRSYYKDNLVVGTISTSQRCLIAAYENRELRLSSAYEVLLFVKNPTWLRATFKTIPREAVVAGHDSDDAVIYVGRAMHQEEMLPAKVIPTKKCCYVAYEHFEIYTPIFEILCGSGYVWRKPIAHAVPENCVSSGKAKNGNILYVGRGHYNGSVTPGVVDIEKRCLLLPYGGKVVKIDDYEVLIKL